jgi:hypothetical protein
MPVIKGIFISCRRICPKAVMLADNVFLPAGGDAIRKHGKAMQGGEEIMPDRPA